MLGAVGDFLGGIAKRGGEVVNDVFSRGLDIVEESAEGALRGIGASLPVWTENVVRDRLENDLIRPTAGEGLERGRLDATTNRASSTTGSYTGALQLSTPEVVILGLTGAALVFALMRWR